MSNYPAPIQNITRSTGTATSTPAKVPANQRNKRSTIKLTNTGAVPIYLYLTDQNDSAPTISGAAFDFVVNPDDYKALAVGDAIGVWIATLSSTATYELLEGDGDVEAWGSASGSPTITGTVPTSSLAEHAEDSAATSGEIGVAMLGVRIDTPASQAAAGDYVWPIFDASNRMWNHGQNEGLDAHDAPITANPTTIGGRAGTSRPAAVADGDAVRAWLDKHGRQVVCHWAPPELWSSDFDIATASTSNIELLAAPGTGLAWAVMGHIVTNTSATQTEAIIKSATTKKYSLPAPAASGAVPTCFPGPVIFGTNEAVNFAAADSVSSLEVWVIAFLVAV